MVKKIGGRMVGRRLAGSQSKMKTFGKPLNIKIKIIRSTGGIKGHAGHLGNETADNLATSEVSKRKNLVTKSG